MTEKSRTLADADIRSRRTVSRRTLLQVLGAGVGVSAASGFTGRAAAQPKRRDPCRDNDHGPSDQDGCGRPTS